MQVTFTQPTERAHHTSLNQKESQPTINASRGELTNVAAAGECSREENEAIVTGKLSLEATAKFNSRFLDVQINTNGG